VCFRINGISGFIGNVRGLLDGLEEKVSRTNKR